VIGKTLAHYEITGRLGEGGMGEVYRAHDTKLDRDIALKILPASVASDPARLERFEREARTVASLNHPHIVHMYSVEESDGARFLTMELVEGEELTATLERGPLTLMRTLEIGVAVADALAEAHGKGIIHRDIKPANVMIANDGRVKVLDFGLAKLSPADSAGDLDATEALELTQEGSVLGTVPYMSPEQLRGHEVDARSDLFSLGILIYQLSSGRRPFEGSSAADITSSILKDEPAPLGELADAIPSALDGIVHSCLEKRPEDRPENAGIVREQLTTLLRELDSGVESAPLLSRARSSSAVSRGPRIAAIVVLALLALAVAWWALHREETGPTEQERPIVAVLPFENLGSPDEEYFAAGITDEITSRLALIEGLGVISNTSARVYAKSEKPIPEVGRELGANYIIEGSIRWDKSRVPERVRISPRLIRVVDDTNLWLDNYEREVDKIFELQSAIASRIAEALDITLLEPVRAAIEQKPTENMEAYQAYLQGSKQLDAPGFSPESFTLGVQMFERATDLDPKFALAWARLSSMHARTYHYGFDRTPGRLNAAKAAAHRAIGLDPRLVEAHIALAHYYYWGTREYDLALVELERARQIEPNNSEVWLISAYVKRRQGAMEEAIQLLQRDQQLSPRDPNVAVALGETFGTLRRYGEAEAGFRRGIELAPEDSYPYTELTLLELRRSGDPDAARARLSEMPSVDSGEASRVRYLVALFDRDWEEALDVIANASVTLFEAGSFYQPAALLEGMVHHLAGDDASARGRFLAARELLGQELERNPEDHRIHAALGIAEAGLDRRAEAVSHAEQAVALYPISGDALGAPVQVVNLALVHALLGDGASAARHLREVLSIPSTMSTAWLRNDPRWDGVRSSDAFQRLLIEFDTQ
jgi:serine/threonine-protein kinase